MANTLSTFGNTLNFDHIFPSQVAQDTLVGISNMLPNSAPNATRQFNTQQFSPLNYLPHTPNYSLQDQFGIQDKFARGGTVDGEFYGDMGRDMRNYMFQDDFPETIPTPVEEKSPINSFIDDTISEPSDEEIYNSMDLNSHAKKYVPQEEPEEEDYNPWASNGSY